jgi:hypothetical protein
MPLKSREYEDRIKSVGFEKGTAWAVSELIERHNMIDRDLKECGKQLLLVTQVLDKIVEGTGMIRKKVEELDRRGRINEDHPTPGDSFDA